MYRLLITLLLFFIKLVSFAGVYYVALSGSDLSNGSSPSSAFQSINRVNQLNLAPGDSILFNRGDVFRGMLILQSSGSASNPIYIGAYGSGDLPVLSGAEILTGFTNSSGNIYQASCPDYPSQLRQVFINNIRHIPARYPNSGYFPMTNVNNTDSTFTAANLTDAASVWDSAALFLRTEHWVIDEFRVKSYVPQQITYTIPPHFYTSYAIQENFGYFLSGKLIALDSAGEWYYNNTTKQLSIIPINADSLLNNGAEVSVYTNCIQFATGVQYITIENLHLEKSLADAMFMNQTSNIIISSCTIVHAGRDGVGGFENYSTYNSSLTVQNCLIRDICNVGINLGDGENVLLIGNDISLNGLIPGMGSGFDVGYSGIYCPSNSKIMNNAVDSIGYIAIHIENNDTTMYNQCSFYGLTKNDCGGIYFWSSSGNYVAYNITGDGHANGQGTIYPDGMMVEGIYSDDYSHNNVIEFNTAYRNESGIIIHNTANSVVRNNVCYDNRRSQLYIVEGNPHVATTTVYGNQIKNNVLQCLHPSQKSLTLETEENNIATMITSCDSNWYCNPYEDEIIEIAYSPGYASANTTFRYTALTLQQWQTNYVLDMNSHTAFDYPSTYAHYTSQGSNLIMNSTFSSGTGWWWIYGNNNFTLSDSPANTNPQITTASLSGQYQNSQTLSPGNWGISSIQTTQNSQYLLTYAVAGQSSGGFQVATTFQNVPYTRNMIPVVIFKSYTTQLAYDTILFTSTYTVSNSLNFNSSSFDGNFWMDDVYLYEVNADTSLAYPHTISKLFINDSGTPLTLSTAGNYRNLDGTIVATNLVLQPYTSVVLKDLSAKVMAIQKKSLANAEIHVFPNPASDKLFLQGSDAFSNQGTIRISDIRGVEMYNAPYNGQEISIPAQWVNGMYLLVYDTAEGQYVTRFVLNK